MSLALVNIDDRLIHGQVATTWIKNFNIESVIIVNDKVSQDPVQKSIAGLAVPGIKVSIFGVDEFIGILKRVELKKVTMVLFTNPMDALTLKKNGLHYSYLNVSGMRFNNERVRLHKNMSVTEKEKEAFEELIEKEHVEIYMQTTTRDDKEKVAVLLKNYK
jgi:PTS system mannose-specific IIB component